MAESTGESRTVTAEEYIKSISPNASVNESAIQGILIDAGIAAGTSAADLTERQRDLAMAYLYIRIASNPLTSQKVSDRDGDWEHSEGSEQWSKSQLSQFLILARKLLDKWGISDVRIDALAPRWDMKGRGFRYRRRSPNEL